MSIAEELEKLQALHSRGDISDEEYTRAKAHVLNDNNSAQTGIRKSLIQQLTRSRSDRLIGGVCGGLGRHTDLPSWAWRVIFCLTMLYFGSGLLIYMLLWIFLPLEP